MTRAGLPLQALAHSDETSRACVMCRNDDMQAARDLTSQLSDGIGERQMAAGDDASLASTACALGALSTSSNDAGSGHNGRACFVSSVCHTATSQAHSSATGQAHSRQNGIKTSSSRRITKETTLYLAMTHARRVESSTSIPCGWQTASPQATSPAMICISLAALPSSVAEPSNAAR